MWPHTDQSVFKQADDYFYSFFARYRKWFYVYIIIVYVIHYFIDGENWGYGWGMDWHWWSIFVHWFMITGGYLVSIFASMFGKALTDGWFNLTPERGQKISLFCWWLFALYCSLYYPLVLIGLDFLCWEC
tara:strand:+ start:49 stop:438 length:390 start_codon:yes stop_codon:yes gene_type:complete